MEAKDIIGKEITTFRFASDSVLKWHKGNEEVLGLSGIIKNINSSYPEYALVQILGKKSAIKEWHYPVEGIIKQLELKEKKEEEEKDFDFDALFEQIKELPHY
jgi:hypothetical protein